MPTLLRRRAAPAVAEPVIDQGDIIARHRHAFVNAEGTWLVFVLAGVDWDNQSVDVHDNIVTAQTHRWAGLAGHRVHMWGLPLEFPAAAFEARMRERFPAPPDQDGFDDMQARKVAYAEVMDAHRLVTVAAVRVSPVRVDAGDLPSVIADHPAANARLEGLRATARRLAGVVAGEGWAGRPVSDAGLTWALRASRTPGIPAPPVRLDRWDAFKDQAGFAEAPVVTADAFGSYSTVRAIRSGATVTSHSAVLRVGEVPAVRDTDEMLPWLGWVDSLTPGPDDDPWRVSWSLAVDVLAGETVAPKAVWHRKRVKAIARHYQQHDADDDQAVGRALDRAEEVVDETTTGAPEDSARAHGQVFLTVSAPSVDGLQRAVEKVTAAAAREQRITLVHQHGQHADLRRTVVGNRWECSSSSAGHVLREPVGYWASAVPNASAAFGDPSGFMAGTIAGSNSVAVLDALAGPRSGYAGVGVIDASQGAGKTTTAVAVAYDLCMSGVPGVAFSPDGTIARILDAAGLAGRGRLIPLTQVTTPGIAMPSLMVPIPPRQPGIDDTEHQGRVDAATASRTRYVRDMLTSLLPGAMQRADGGTAGMLIGRAVAATVKDDPAGGYGMSPWAVVDELAASDNPRAREVADELTARAVQPSGRLAFPPRGEAAESTVEKIRSLIESDALFTCITIPGVATPRTSNRDDWSDEEWDAIPVLMSGLRLASLALYSSTRPGWAILDEVDIAAGGVSAFASFLRCLIYDIRRYDKWVGLLVKSMSTLKSLDEDVTSLLGWAMLGRMGADGARAGMRLLGPHVDPGIADDVPALSDGEFYVRWFGQSVRRVAFDQAWWPADLITNTYTKPGEPVQALPTPIQDW